MRRNLLRVAAKKRTALVTEYATWNPVDKGVVYALSNGNRTLVNNLTPVNSSARATQPKTSGKWYIEMAFPEGLVDQDGAVALSASDALVIDTYPGSAGDSVLYTASSGNPLAQLRFTANALSGVISAAPGTVVGLAVDVDNRKAWVSSDGVWLLGDPATGVSPAITWSESFPVCLTQRLYYNGYSCVLNAGQEAFLYGPPAGFSSGWFEEV